MVGWAEGLAVGFSVGRRVGLAVGDSVGTREGAAVGDRVGNGTTSGKSVGFLKFERLTLDRLPPEIARIASAFAPERSRCATQQAQHGARRWSTGRRGLEGPYRTGSRRSLGTVPRGGSLS